MNAIVNTGRTISFLALATASMLCAEEAVAAKFSFASQQTYKCLVGALDGRVLTDTCYNTRLNQQWHQIVDPSGTISYKNASTGLCLRVVNRVMSSATCSSSETKQDFAVIAVSDAQGFIQIVKINSAGTAADCFASLSGTSVSAYQYPTPCINPALIYSWRAIPR